MMTTTGTQEKCIDIQLAVEMMHFASVPGAYADGAVLEVASCTAALHERRLTSHLPSHRYDCAVLLSGDKDFIPALSRIRQKGKQAGRSSSAALSTTKAAAAFTTTAATTTTATRAGPRPRTR